jgi:adenylate kinase family enzyme
MIDQNSIILINTIMLKIGICGAHGTGKTTLAREIAEIYNLPIISQLMRNFWQEYGVMDFEKLPKDVRTTFQKESLLRQIDAEDSTDDFVTDRTVLDQIAYTTMSSNMTGVDLAIYEQLCRERLERYTHLIYLPIEFDVEAEFLRADINSRDELAVIMKDYLDKWFKGRFIEITGTLEERKTKLKEILTK